MNSIIRACTYGDLDTLKKILKPADINKAYPEGLSIFYESYETPLLCAIKNKQSDVAKYLIEQGADLYIARDKYFCVSIIEAVYSNMMDIVKICVESKMDLNTELNSNYVTPLIAAIKTNNLNMVKYLLKNGADPNYSNKYFVPIVEACEYKNFSIIKCLLEAKADPNKTLDNVSALAYAIHSKNPVDYVRLLLEHGADLNHQDNYGNTILMDSIKLGNKELFNFLINRGADINKINLNNETALSICLDTDGEPLTKNKYDMFKTIYSLKPENLTCRMFEVLKFHHSDFKFICKLFEDKNSLRVLLQFSEGNEYTIDKFLNLKKNSDFKFKKLIRKSFKSFDTYINV